MTGWPKPTVRTARRAGEIGTEAHPGLFTLIVYGRNQVWNRRDIYASVYIGFRLW